ncbi:MAG TPA: carboxypeptidase regulatory-like domain-containing protein [Planctomycetota bacterium]|nr:carboxypeptidase regulatory-like domain-containing protein [Planctomycetota bacterium]
MQPIELLVPRSIGLDELASLERGEDRVRGRVRDRDGQPVGDAAVWLVPERDTQAWMGLDGSAESTAPLRIPVERFARAITASDGSFRVTSKRWRDGRRITATTSMQEPWLIVVHPDFSPATLRCNGPRESELELPDIVLAERSAGLRVRVVDERGEPISGAVVRVRHGRALYAWSRARGPSVEHTLIELQSGRTSSDGGLVMTGLAPGESHALIEEPAHSSELIRSIDLVEGATIDGGHVTLRRRGPGLAGRVVDERGEPVAAADVFVADRFVHRPDDHAELHRLVVGLVATGWHTHTPVARTNEEGWFETDRLDSPSVTALVLAAGFEPTFVDACVPSAGAVTIPLQPKTPFDLAFVDARSGSRVTGAEVLSVEHEATAPYVHKLADRASQDVTWEPIVEPGAPDRFRVHGGCAEPLMITVAAPGYATTQVQARPPIAGEPAIVELPLEREAMVQGRAVDSEGRGLPAVEVNLRKPKEAWTEKAWKGPPIWHGPIWTGQDGAFHIDRLEAGEWELTLDGGDRASMARVFPLEPSQVLELGDVLVGRVGRIAGRVVGAHGVPAAGVRVSAVPDPTSPRRLRWTTSDERGRFSVESLAPGRWKLSAPDQAHRAAAVSVVVVEGETSEVELPSRRGPRVVGRVLADGRPVPGAAIAINQDDGRGWNTYDSIVPADADGRFDCEWSEGGVSLIAIAPWGGSSRPVRSPSGVDEVLEADLILADGQLGGVVQGATTSESLAGIEVELFGPWWDGAVEPVRTDGAGRFVFAHVSAHEYRIRCVDPSGAHATVETGPWPIADGERRTDLVLKLTPSAEVILSIEFGAGVPAPDGTPVYLFGAGHDEPLRRSTSRDGSCTFDRLEPGTYAVAAGAEPGHWGGITLEMNPVSVEVLLASGERREIRLDFPRH